MYAYMKESIDQLREEVARQTAQPSHNHKPAQQYTPLRDQIIRLVAEMPPDLRCRSWSITELVRQLQGRYRAHPQPQMVARELIALGWRKTRIWASEGRGSRIWHPPQVSSENINEGNS